jgi:UDP-3-O-[3-hydroxymyristoyl] glucosamine N-acyltransferase
VQHPGFFKRSDPIRIADIASGCGAQLPPGADPDGLITDIRPLSEAGAGQLSFLDNKKYLPQLETTRATACFIKPEFADRVPEGVIALETPQPYHAFARGLFLFYPEAATPQICDPCEELVSPSAVLEEGVIVEPGAIIGPEAHIGSGTRIAAGAIIGRRVYIGRNSYIGAGATIAHTLVGDGVIIHTGVRLGQDGFGFAMGPAGHEKVPQIGRVIIQDKVEIGANTTIDRGALNDTIIGEGTKIDNLVQIGHNVVTGRNCVIVAQTGISGSAQLGDFVIMGGQSGCVGHITLGHGVQVAGASHVKADLEPGQRVGGTPARPLRQWAKEMATLTRLASKRSPRSE